MKNNQFVIGLVTVSLSLILHVCYCTFYLSYLSPSIIVIIIAFIAGIIFLIVSKKNFCKEEESLRLKLGMALFLKREKEEEIHNFFRCIQYEYEKETGTTLLLDNIASITYLKADVIQCHFNDSVIIANICNDGGNWDNDFALSLSKRWEQPEQEYRQWQRSGYYHIKADSSDISFEIGRSLLVKVETSPNIYVDNLISIRNQYGTNTIHYQALEDCIESLAFDAMIKGASVHISRACLVRACCDWEKVEAIIQRKLIAANIPVYIYDSE